MKCVISVERGLPPYGKPARAFSATGLGLHFEGLVIRFELEPGQAWIANFVRGMTTFDLATVHPNGKHALIIAGGQGYVVDPGSEELKEVFGGAVVMAFAHPTRNAIVVNHQDLAFEAIGSHGRLWKTRRISWDGFRGVQVVGGVVKGEAWRPDDTWHAFTVDLETGHAAGGSYDDAR